jgi:hypothetical protein
MWPTLVAEIASRYAAAHTYFAAIAGPQGGPAVLPPPPHEVTAKGLIFVQMYAIYEHSVKNIVRLALAEMRGRAMPLNTIRLELMGLVLTPELQSVRDCGAETAWRSRVDLFKRIGAPDAIDVADDVFPSDGSHYRRRQLDTIWELFGLAVPVVHTPRALGLITELVEHRNAIAHGRATAEDVGRRFSRDDCYLRLDLTRDLCTYLATTMETHCSHPPNLTR